MAELDSVVQGDVLTGVLASSAACTTKDFHVNRAKEFYSKGRLFFALAKEEDWEDSQVQTPNYNTELEGVWGYKRVETKYLVVPDENGDLVFQRQRFRIVSPDEANEQGARWLYIMSYVNYDELPFKTYHQIGIVSDVTFKEGVAEGTMAVTPDEVEFPGYLEIINNRKGVGREPDLREQLALVIEF